MMKLAFALLFFASVSFADSHTLINTDIFELEIAADPQISPDGSQLAYTRLSMDIMTDRPVSNIWTVDVAGGNHRPLLSGAGNYTSPRWSPQGDRLAYVSEVEGRGAQIHLRWMDTGQTAVLSNVRQKPSSITWSPDGKQIAFEMFVESEGTKLVTPPKSPEGAQWAPPVKVIENIQYRSDSDGYLDTGFDHLFVLSAQGGTPRQLTSGDFDHGGPLSWAPGGEKIYFSANRQEDPAHDSQESEIWTVDLAGGELVQLTDRDGPDFSPRISADGSKLAYLGFDDQKMGYHNTDVYLMDLKDGSIDNLTSSFDRDIDDVQWAGKLDRLYVQYADHGKSHIATLASNGDVTSLASDISGVSIGRPYTSGGFTVAGKGTYAYSAGDTRHPADIAAGRAGHKPKRITDLNTDLLGHKTLASVEEINWQSSHDGLDIQGWLVKPPGFDKNKKYPLILEIHGGPFAAYGPHFSAEIQLYAAAGYVVLYSNPRGSTSYGADFANEIHHNYPGQDYDDLMSGVDAAIERGFIDQNALYVTGGSGGGVLSAWIVGKTDRFRAAVVAKPVINWSSFALTSDGAPFYSQYWFDKMPWEDPQAYWARSPLSLVGNVSTPTALLTGEQDFRTPIGESEQFFEALKIRKIDSILIRVPEATHGIAARPSHLIAKVDNILAWFARYAEQ